MSQSSTLCRLFYCLNKINEEFKSTSRHRVYLLSIKLICLPSLTSEKPKCFGNMTTIAYEE